MDRPYGMLAELTYACPLHCPYCSNPLNLADYREELTTAEWQRVLTEARELGVLQLHLSGGEPLQRRDLEELVASARDLGLYTNLITSALALSPRRAEGLKAAGLDHVQISIQADEPALSDRIAGTPSYGRKIAAARLVKELDWPLTLNVVLHRHNIDRVGRILDLADLGPFSRHCTLSEATEPAPQEESRESSCLTAFPLFRRCLMVVLGIDVGKRELFVSLQETQSGTDVRVIGKRGPIANTAAGLHDLTTWLQKRTSGDVQVVMEATSVYWERCAHHFHARGVAVSVVNPAQIKYFARSV